jgi:hypothetical protein
MKKYEIFFWKMKKYEIFQISHGVNPEKFRKDLGSDPQNSWQNLTNFGKKKTHDFLEFCLFWRNFKSFPETKPHHSGEFRKYWRADPEGSRQSLAEVKNTEQQLAS